MGVAVGRSVQMQNQPRKTKTSDTRDRDLDAVVSRLRAVRAEEWKYFSVACAVSPLLNLSLSEQAVLNAQLATIRRRFSILVKASRIARSCSFSALTLP